MDSDLKLVVTTSLKAHPDVIASARDSAERWGLPFALRDKAALGDTIGPDASALVFTNSELHLANEDGILRFHLGTAFIRLKAFQRGELDPLVRAAEVVTGDRVLDTTFGLGRDARVIARAVGESGQVVGLESSSALFHLADVGLQRRGDNDFVQGSASIELVHTDALSYLASCESDSFDLVLIDPMFDEPTTSDAGFELLRAVADPTPLSRDWVEHAKRVARRWVIVKANGSLPWFDEHDLAWVRSNSNAGWYRSPAH